jgi:hypothetical protein
VSERRTVQRTKRFFLDIILIDKHSLLPAVKSLGEKKFELPEINRIFQGSALAKLDHHLVVRRQTGGMGVSMPMVDKCPE